MDIQVLSSGKLIFQGKTYRCALGDGGVTSNKKEGDGATPAGCFSIRRFWYRADKIEKPVTVLPIKALEEHDGWCDDPTDENYNQYVELPYKASHEKLWREDDLYDIIAVLGFNDDPPVPGGGSAIFMHVAREGFTPTAGCIALSKNDLLEILERLESNTRVKIANS